MATSPLLVSRVGLGVGVSPVPCLFVQGAARLASHRIACVLEDVQHSLPVLTWPPHLVHLLRWASVCGASGVRSRPFGS